jgi:FkbM family methyltransferase
MFPSPGNGSDAVRIHTFENGIKVFDHYLINEQRSRYAHINLHEPVEERWILDLCHRAPNGHFQFWDVGAGIGYYSLLVASMYPNARVEAFEPLERYADAIARHGELNGIAANKIAIHRNAIAKVAGPRKLVDESFGSVLLPNGSEADVAINVIATPIDDLLTSSEIQVDVIKVDVQGLELDVIEGSRQSTGRIKNWVVGTHGAAIHAACHAALADLGYTVVFSESTVDGQPDGLIVASHP